MRGVYSPVPAAAFRAGAIAWGATMSSTAKTDPRPKATGGFAIGAPPNPCALYGMPKKLTLADVARVAARMVPGWWEALTDEERQQVVDRYNSARAEEELARKQ